MTTTQRGIQFQNQSVKRPKRTTRKQNGLLTIVLSLQRNLN